MRKSKIFQNTHFLQFFRISQYLRHHFSDFLRFFNNTLLFRETKYVWDNWKFLSKIHFWNLIRISSCSIFLNLSLKMYKKNFVLAWELILVIRNSYTSGSVKWNVLYIAGFEPCPICPIARLNYSEKMWDFFQNFSYPHFLQFSSNIKFLIL